MTEVQKSFSLAVAQLGCFLTVSSKIEILLLCHLSISLFNSRPWFFHRDFCRVYGILSRHAPSDKDQFLQIFINSISDYSKQVKQRVSERFLFIHNLEEEITYTFSVRAQTIDYGPPVQGNVTTGMHIYFD